MTDDQRSAISKLRAAGWGYTKIANHLDLSVNTVKSFCRRNHLSGYADKTLQACPEGPYRRCKNCGALIEQNPKRKAKLFCSDKCRMSWWTRHQDELNRKAVYDYVCPNCGKAFTAYGNAHRKYCCHACYIADRFRKKAV